VPTIGAKLKTLAQMEDHVWNIDSMSLSIKCTIEWSFETYGDISFKKFMVMGFLHYYALESLKNRVVGDNEPEGRFTAIDALDGMKRRWPDHSWHRSYMDRCFAELQDAGMIKKAKGPKRTDKRRKYFSVTSKFIHAVADFYINTCITANGITASRRHNFLHEETKRHEKQIAKMEASGVNTTLDFLRRNQTDHPTHKNRFKTVFARKKEKEWVQNILKA